MFDRRTQVDIFDNGIFTLIDIEFQASALFETENIVKMKATPQSLFIFIKFWWNRCQKKCEVFLMTSS